MARIDVQTFDANSTTANILGGDIFSGATISTTHARTGTYAMRVSSLASTVAQGYLKKWLGSTAAGPYYLKFGIYVVTLPSSSNTIVQFNGASGSLGTTARCYITLESNGTLILRNATGTQIGSASAAINDSTFHVVELKHDGTPASGSRIIEGRLDGSVFATSSAQSQGNPLAYSVGGNLASEAQTTGEWWIDDVALNDSTGTAQTGYPGLGRQLYLVPNAAGDVNSFATQTGGTAGAGNNFTRVNEVPPNDATSFNGSSTLNQEDLFNVTDSGIGASDTVNAVLVGIRVRNNTADVTSAIKAEIEKTGSGTISQGTAIIPNTTSWNTNGTSTPRNYTLVLYKDPDGTDWTQTTLDSMQIGYKLTAVGVNRVEVTAVWAVVDYTPSGGQTASATAIASTAALGAPTLSPGVVTISPTGISSTASIGAPTVSSTYLVSATGIASGGSVGSPTLSPGGVSISPTGLASTVTFGAPILAPGAVSISPSSVVSALTFGSPVLSPGSVSTSATGIAPTAALGAPPVSSTYDIAATGIASANSIGAPTVSTPVLGQNISPASVAPTLTIGTVVVSSVYVILPAGIASTASIGAPTLSPGAVSIQPSSIVSGMTFGVPTIVPGSVSISASSIASTLALGSVAVSSVYSISVTGISSGFSIGAPTVSSAITVLVSSIASTASIGVPTLTNSKFDQVISPRSIRVDQNGNLIFLVDGTVAINIGGNVYLPI
jgi:hypothetical protein